MQRPSISQAAIKTENPSRLDKLPRIVSNNEAWQLFDLLKSDFKMLAGDKDFDLTHE